MLRKCCHGHLPIGGTSRTGPAQGDRLVPLRKHAPGERTPLDATHGIRRYPKIFSGNLIWQGHVRTVNKSLSLQNLPNSFKVERMQAEERQKRIEEYLQKVEFASLDELAQQVAASLSTIRRDLTILEGNGNLRRTHGGARLINPKSDEFAFSARETHEFGEKDAIGKACAELIKPNQTIIIDAGSTC